MVTYALQALVACFEPCERVGRPDQARSLLAALYHLSARLPSCAATEHVRRTRVMNGRPFCVMSVSETCRANEARGRAARYGLGTGTCPIPGSQLAEADRRAWDGLAAVRVRGGLRLVPGVCVLDVRVECCEGSQLVLRCVTSRHRSARPSAMWAPHTIKPLRGRSWTARVVIVAMLSGLVSAGFTGLATSADAAGASYTTSAAACAGIDPGTY